MRAIALVYTAGILFRFVVSWVQPVEGSIESAAESRSVTPPHGTGRFFVCRAKLGNALPRLPCISPIVVVYELR